MDHGSPDGTHVAHTHPDQVSQSIMHNRRARSCDAGCPRFTSLAIIDFGFLHLGGGTGHFNGEDSRMWSQANSTPWSVGDVRGGYDGGPPFPLVQATEDVLWSCTYPRTNGRPKRSDGCTRREEDGCFFGLGFSHVSNGDKFTEAPHGARDLGTHVGLRDLANLRFVAYNKTGIQ